MDELPCDDDGVESILLEFVLVFRLVVRLARADVTTADGDDIWMLFELRLDDTTEGDGVP